MNLETYCDVGEHGSSTTVQNVEAQTPKKGRKNPPSTHPPPPTVTPLDWLSKTLQPVVKLGQVTRVWNRR